MEYNIADLFESVVDVVPDRPQRPPQLLGGHPVTVGEGEDRVVGPLGPVRAQCVAPGWS